MELGRNVVMMDEAGLLEEQQHLFWHIEALECQAVAKAVCLARAVLGAAIGRLDDWRAAWWIAGTMAGALMDWRLRGRGVYRALNDYCSCV